LLDACEFHSACPCAPAHIIAPLTSCGARNFAGCGETVTSL
jgi:hypothetical protein